MVSSQWHNIKLIEYYNIHRALKEMEKKREKKRKKKHAKFWTVQQKVSDYNNDL